MVVTHEVYIEYDQVSDLNEEIKPHWNICNEESVKEEYNKPLTVDETFLPIEVNNVVIRVRYKRYRFIGFQVAVIFFEKIWSHFLGISNEKSATLFGFI